MDKNGNPRSLVASHPGNTNAAKYGVYSQRLIQPQHAKGRSGGVEQVDAGPGESVTTDSMS
jgi:hypothetical protein